MQQQRSLNMELSLTGTKRVDEVFNLSLTLPSQAEMNALENGDYIEREFQFSSGVLAKVSNSMILQVARNAAVTSIPIMCLYIKLSPQPTERAWINSSVTLSFVDPSKPENVIVSPISRTANNQYFPKRDGYLGYEFVPASWPQQVCVANFAIPVVYRKLPSLTDEKSAATKDGYLPGKLDSKEFFGCETFSDVVIECKGATFPAHRLILAGNSPVFKKMLSHPTKEAEDGRIVIKDVNAEVLEGLLKFIYTGEIEAKFLDEHGEALYQAADKYDVEALLVLCENHLLKNVSFENALVMYDLAQSRPESSLAKKSSEIIARNKDGVAADVESFKNFTIKYPGLIFEIFKSS